MANKRTLKQTINLVCDELFTEAVAASLYGNGNNQGNTEAILYSIIRMRSEYTARVQHPEPGMPKKHYYKDLKEKFAACVSDIVDHIDNM